MAGRPGRPRHSVHLAGIPPCAPALVSLQIKQRTATQMACNEEISTCCCRTCSAADAGDTIMRSKVWACLQAEEAEAMARRMVQVYADFATDVAAMPVVVGAPPSPSRASLLQTWAPQLCGGCACVPGGQPREACAHVVARAEIEAGVFCGRE